MCSECVNRTPDTGVVVCAQVRVYVCARARPGPSHIQEQKNEELCSHMRHGMRRSLLAIGRRWGATGRARPKHRAGLGAGARTVPAPPGAAATRDREGMVPCWALLPKPWG